MCELLLEGHPAEFDPLLWKTSYFWVGMVMIKIF